MFASSPESSPSPEPSGVPETVCSSLALMTAQRSHARKQTKPGSPSIVALQAAKHIGSFYGRLPVKERRQQSPAVT